MSLLEENTLNQNRPQEQTDDFGLSQTSVNQKYSDILKLACFITGCSSAYISVFYNGSAYLKYSQNLFIEEACINKFTGALPIYEQDFFEIADLPNQTYLKNFCPQVKQRYSSYACVPFADSVGTILGILAVLDAEGKQLLPEQIAHLKILSKQLVSLFELEKINAEKAAIEKSVDENRIFFENSSSVIGVLTDKLEIKVINNAAYDIFGYKPAECQGLNIANFILPEDRDKVFEIATECLKNRTKKFRVETRIRTKTNEIKWITWSVANKNRKWFVIGREITAERETSKSLAQLLIAANKINSGIVISNAKSEVVFVNPAFTAITNYVLSDFNGQRLGDVLAGVETNKELIEKVRQEMKNKQSSSADFLAYKKGGEKIWLSVHSSVILDIHGEIDSLVEIILDITARKESEKQLELLSLVASKTNNGVSICDKEGNVTWINAALENILGFKNEEVIGRKLIDFVKGEDTDLEILEIVREKAKRFEPFNFEHKVYRRDGKAIWLSIANTPIYNKTTNQYKQIEIINDITQRKQAEFQLLASREETLRLSKAKESFVSIMSHEIRTPLNAVIGLANILNDEEKLPEQVESINLLKFSADNLLTLVNDILDFNKIEIGKMALENKRLDIRALLKDIVASMRFKIGEKQIKLGFKVDDNVPELVRGDKTRVYQILVNLINNAIKFTDEGAVEVLVGLKPETDNKVSLSFKVIDTGIGIPEDKLDAIFEPFTQAESNTSRKYGGSGLGLSITKRLVNLFGGDIKVESTLGVGTQFSFNLKFNKFEGALDMVETQQKIVLAGKILVVDDNEINTLLAQRVLSKFGLTVITANSGASAIEVLKSKDFDVVLMDLHMPELNGYQTTERLRALDDDYYKTLPIIALTASVLDDELDGIEQSGMTDFQLKPFKPDELATKIAKYLS